MAAKTRKNPTRWSRWDSATRESVILDASFIILNQFIPIAQKDFGEGF